MQTTPSASYSLTLRAKLSSRAGTLGDVASAIGRAGGDIGAIDIVSVTHDFITRDITVSAISSEHGLKIVDAVRDIDGVEVINVSDRTFLMHLGGKIEVVSKMPLKTRADLSMAYTPGVARVCEAISQDPEKAFTLTIKKNTVAIVSDGTAVLGLGDIGPAAAMPVMEGKAMLFKEFAGVDGFPICLNTKDPEEIVRTVKAIAPGFGGINLEDISAPRCFQIEERLKEELDIPVFHDDQHGTAVVVLAALLNALKIVGKKMSDVKVIVNGVGAAGVACTKIIMAAGVQNVIGCDQSGALYAGRRERMNWVKDWYAQNTNPNQEQGTVKDVIKGADVFIGLSVPGVIDADDVKGMAAKPIVFAMANPTPEIMPEEAAPYVAVMATGRSDYPNQINNVLCFPGIFRGALACRASTINEEMKLAAAHAIAGIITDSELHPEYIVPSVFDKRVAEAVAREVEEAACQTGVARRDRQVQEEDYEIEIDDSTFELLSAIAKADDDALSLAAIAEVEPKEFRTFLRQSGEDENKYALQLLKAAESRLLILKKQRDRALSQKSVGPDLRAPAEDKTLGKTRARIKVPIRVSRKRPETMTKQITDQLTRLIEDGTWAVGSYLPSERDLANSLNVARNVVRGSYENLIKAGRIKSEGKKGRSVRQAKGAAKKSRSAQKATTRSASKKAARTSRK